MSAFVVCKEHIEVLVGAASGSAAHGVRFSWWFDDERRYLLGVDGCTPVELAELLVWENQASVNYRYGTCDVTDYVFSPRAFLRGQSVARRDPVGVLRWIACYEYQSCEHPSWESSEAKAVCDALRLAVIGSLPGYKDAPGEFTASDITPYRLRLMDRYVDGHMDVSQKPVADNDPSSYDGWANRETATVFDYLTGTDPDFATWKDEAVAALEASTGVEDPAALDLAERMEKYWEEMQNNVVEDVPLPRPAREALFEIGSLWRVDWQAIAKHFVEDLALDEETN